mgnify:CR=1 FL=1
MVSTYQRVMSNQFYQCVFNSTLPPSDETYEIISEGDVKSVRYFNKKTFCSYSIDQEFIEAGGLADIEALPTQQKTILGFLFLNASEQFGIKPVLCYENQKNRYTDSKLKAFSVEDVKDFSVDHIAKPMNLMAKLKKKTIGHGMFQQVSLDYSDRYRMLIADDDELSALCSYLKDNDLINFGEYMGFLPYRDDSIVLTVAGHQVLNEKMGKLSNKVFVAMQFDWAKNGDALVGEPQRVAFLEAVQKACSEEGYIASTVSDGHTNFITDQIINEIRAARFVIVDFTFNNRGAYFEAGFARALGKEVIHLVNASHISGISDYQRLHFDIEHINYISWTTPEEVQSKVLNRIKSLGF